MELFIMKRYLGEPTSAAHPANEIQLKMQLLSKIKEKKRQRERATTSVDVNEVENAAVDNNDINVDSSNSQLTVKKKNRSSKKNKSKAPNEDLSQNTASITTDPCTSTSNLESAETVSVPNQMSASSSSSSSDDQSTTSESDSETEGETEIENVRPTLEINKERKFQTNDSSQSTSTTSESDTETESETEVETGVENLRPTPKINEERKFQTNDSSQNTSTASESDTETESETGVENLRPTPKIKKERKSQTNDSNPSTSEALVEECISTNEEIIRPATNEDTIINHDSDSEEIENSQPTLIIKKKGKKIKSSNVKRKRNKDDLNSSNDSQSQNVTNESVATPNDSQTVKRRKKLKTVNENTELNSANEGEEETVKLTLSEEKDEENLKDTETLENKPNKHSEGSDLNTANSKDLSDEDDQQNFSILGTDLNKKKESIKRVLPAWLANPTIIPVDLQNLSATVDSIPYLDQVFVDTLKRNKVTHFFPVQAQLIPWILSMENRRSSFWPNDVCVSAPTGSGKTLAFVLPILQSLYKRTVPVLRALVVLPVQDLATQVYKVFKTYAANTPLQIILLKNTTKIECERELLLKYNKCIGFESRVDIIITTPGRLVDHFKLSEGFSLDDLKYLVIDEADRVMDNMQNDWLQHYSRFKHGETALQQLRQPLSLWMMKSFSQPPQKLLFSATLSQDPEKLQMLDLFQPKLFTSIVGAEPEIMDLQRDAKKKGDIVGKYTTPSELHEAFIVAPVDSRPIALHHLITTRGWDRILCFVKSNELVHRLCVLLKSLNPDFKIGEITADRDRKERNKILNWFKQGVLNMIVSSDALARGIDIPHVDYVVLYHPPKFIKNYIHRVGRTARAGAEGTAVTFLSPKDIQGFRKMVSSVGKNNITEIRVEENELEPYYEEYQTALKKLKKVLLQESSRTRPNGPKQRKRYKKRPASNQNAAEA